MADAKNVHGFFHLFYRSWWVVVFVCACLLIYVQAVDKKKQACQALENQLISLHSEKEALLQKHEDLILQIHSQNDPSWIEMTLMKKIGVVPEGQLKVYFRNDQGIH